MTNVDLSGVIMKIVGILNTVLILFMAVAVVMFVFYVIKYYMRPDSDRKEAGSYVMWSVIGFFIIFSFWGIVNILQNTFGLGNSNTNTTWSSVTNIFPR